MPAVLAALGLAACGSSSMGSGGSSGHSAAAANPRALVQRAFSSSDAVKSGKLTLDLSVALKGSDSVTTPVSLRLSGPYSDASSGASQSAFTIAITALGHSLRFGTTSTSAGDFLTLEGTSYTLPAGAVGSLGSSTKGSLPGLSSLGVDPAHWLTDPRIVSTPTVNGVQVDRVTAGVDVPAFIKDLNTLLTKEVASSSAAKSAGVPSSISAATASRIEKAIKNPTVRLDIGRSDELVRDLVLHLTIPISGTTSSELGGATSASVTLSTRYADLNQPQTITAPANPQPYSRLKSRLSTLAKDLDGALTQSEGSSTAPSSSGSGATGTASTASGATTTGAGSTSKYTRCINDAKGNVAKMQKCAALVDGQ